jgi:hypothetical protein
LQPHARLRLREQAGAARVNPRLALLVAALVGEATCLGLAVRFGDLAVAGNALHFVPLLLLASVCFLVAVVTFPGTPAQSPAKLLWIPCIALRVMALPTPPGDDLWRYLWEGRVQLAGHNPYQLAPSAPELAPLRNADWEKINHEDSPAIYPPLAELILAGLARLSPTAYFFKLTFIFADLLTVALLFALVQSRGSPPAPAVAWYAWNPAVVYAFAGAGHFDSLMLLALTASLLALVRLERESSWRLAALSAVGLGMAIALKLVPIFLLPVWAFALRRRAPVLVLAVAIPFLLTIPYGGPAIVFRPLLAFAEVSRFNDLVWGFLERITRPNPFGRNWPFTLILSLVVAICSWKLRHDWPRAALWVLGSALILSPVLHPWYVTWILPLAVWRGQHAWTVLSLSALSALLLWETTPLWTAWQPTLLTRAFVAIPPLVAWAILQSKVAKVLPSAR